MSALSRSGAGRHGWNRLTQFAPVSTAQPRMRRWTSVRGFDGAKRCGDVVVTRDLSGGRCAVVVADVAGRGCELSSTAYSVASQTLDLMEIGCPPHIAVAITDRDFRRYEPAREVPRFVGAFAATIDPSVSEIVYASAGHDVAALIFSDRSVRELEANGPVLGLLDDPDFGKGQVRFSEDASLVVVSDGISDSRPRGGRTFGLEGVAETVCSALVSGCDPAAALINDASDYAGSHPGDDKSAFVVAYPSLWR